VSYFVDSTVSMEPVDKGWRLLSSFRYYSDTINGNITVPAGFFTDLASVPRIMRWLVPVANAKNRKAAIVHDYLCYEEIQEMYNIDQRTADKIFREALAVCNVNPIGQWTMWAPVRAYQWTKGLFK
jgi:hypothetical protein